MRRDIYQAIADPTRRAIITLIALHAMTPNAIAKHFDNSRQSVSKHLKILTECELVSQKFEGREIYYQLEIKKMKEIDKWLEQFRKIWEERFNELDNVLNKLKSKKNKMNISFDFIVNKETNTINVKRAFAANLDLVWEAWTNPEILDQWWAPKPYRTETKSMDFKVGGTWFYAMVSPQGEKHWCKADYNQIDYHKSFSGLDAFCDENGKINEDFPRSLWNNKFIPEGDTTLVNITIKYDSLNDLEKIIELGFKEGFTMALGNLDQYIETQLRNK